MKSNIFKRVIDNILPSEGKVEVALDDAENRGVTYGPTNAVGLPYGFASPPLSLQSSMQLSAVYRCVEVISDAIASQTWDVQEWNKVEGWSSNPFNDVAYMLNNEPSPSMSRFTMMKTLVAKVLLEGNGYLIIRRNGIGDPISLDLVNDTVKIFKREDGTLYYEVGKPGDAFIVDGSDMIHILNFTYDGYNGVSTLRHAALTMGLANASEASAKGFFLSGANMSGILSTENKLTKEKAADIKASWANAFNVTSGNPGGIAVMEAGLKFDPVTVNPKDAQMLETRQFNVVEICRFFGVSPSKVFDSNNLTYSNIESFQLGFLTDTISPLDSKIECEFNRKLLRPSKRIKTRLNLNIEELLRANMDAKANYYSKLFQVGAFTPNEIRSLIGQPKVDGGDKSYVQINLMPVDTPIAKNVQKPINKQINTQTDENSIS